MTDWMDTLSFTPASDKTIKNTYPARGEGGTASSAMIGQTIRTVKCYLKDAGSTSLTGTIYCEVRKMSDNTLQHSISTIEADTLTSSYTLQTFSTGSGYVLLNGDTICLRYSVASATMFIAMSVSDNVNAYDGTNSGRTNYEASGSVWSTETVEDWLALFSDVAITPPSSGGGRLPPPPIVLGGL